MTTDLIELARFPTSAEASIVRAQLECEGIRAELSDEETANSLWHIGTALGGVRLWVKREDAARAMDILGTHDVIDGNQDIDFGDESDDDPSDDDRSELPKDLIRAWRSSLIGLVLLPPFLNIYSIWLLLRNGLFIGRCRNWRVFACLAVNAFVLFCVLVIVGMIAFPAEQSPHYFSEDDEPLEVEFLLKTDTIRLP